MEDTKKCTKCGKELPLDQFYKLKSKDNNIKYSSWCKGCFAEANRKWSYNNRDKKRAITAKWRKENKEKIRASSAEWRKNNIDKCRAYDAKKRQNNPEKKKASDAKWYYNNLSKVRAANAKWQKDNPEKCRIRNAKWRKNNPKYQTKYERNRRINDVTFRIMKNIKAAIRLALINSAKSGRTIDLLGCSIEYLRDHLERQFNLGMTWDNYGLHGWHIDHIIPLSYFDMSDLEQQKHAWHYTNLQPLWAGDNIRKSNKIEERQLLLL